MNEAAAPVLAYDAYGLRIHSSLALWPGGTGATQGCADVLVSHRVGTPGSGRLFRAAAMDTAVSVPDVGEMRVRDGSRIELTLADHCSPEAAAILAAGAGLGMVLTQRGWFVLHGSAIRIGATGICVAGPSGAGKSTILAELHRRGHFMIADGMTPLRLSDGHVLAAPGPPIMKVWPSTAREMGWATDSLIPVSSAHDKRFRPVTERVEQQPVPIRNVFATVAVAPVGVSMLEPREALMELVKHAFLMEFSDVESGAMFLRQSASLASFLSVARLSRGDRIRDLLDVAEVLGHACVVPS
jgi:hypothetical protein